MSKPRNAAALISLCCALAVPFAANAFEKVTSKSEFLELVQGKNLRLTGIRLNVSSSGAIQGKAYGYPVKGDWQWRGAYFCRSLFWGDTNLGDNCQEVSAKDGKIRFTSDRGAGSSAVLSLR